MARKPICKRTYDTSGYGYTTADTMPREYSAHEGHLTHGYAVSMTQRGTGNVVAFHRALEPALVHGHAARMSDLVSGYGVFHAYKETLYCPDHGDETVIVVVGESLDRLGARGRTDALDDYARDEFARVARSDSAYWHGEYRTPDQVRRRAGAPAGRKSVR